MGGKFVAYYRGSIEKQGKSGLSLGGQRRVVASYLENSNSQLLDEFTEIEGGRRSHRPELEKALATCEKHKAKLIIARLGRLSRSVAFIATMLERSKVEFVCCDHPKANKRTVRIIAAIAEHECDRLANQIRDAFAAAKAAGTQIGNPRLGQNNRKAAAARAEAVRPAITETIHLSMLAAANELNRRGIRTASGKQWHATQVRRVRNRLGLTTGGLRTIPTS